MNLSGCWACLACTYTNTQSCTHHSPSHTSQTKIQKKKHKHKLTQQIENTFYAPAKACDFSLNSPCNAENEKLKKPAGLLRGCV